MNADMSEIDVKQTGFRGAEKLDQSLRLRSVDRDRAAQNRLLPEAAELMGARFRHDRDVVERKLIGIFPLLAKDHRAEGAHGLDLPVDVEHLRLQEGGHVLRRDGERGLRGGSQAKGCRKVCCVVRLRYRA